MLIGGEGSHIEISKRSNVDPPLPKKGPSIMSEEY